MAVPIPRHDCDFATPPHRRRVSEGGPAGTSSFSIRRVFREGLYVRQSGGPRNTSEDIGQGLRRAFPLPVSGAFQDLIEALDRVDDEEGPMNETGKPKQR